MALSDAEIERYARHIVLPGIGGPGQARFKAARVLVVGAGGLGAPVLQYLAAAGIGTLGVIDDDLVSLSNLQRQVIHQTASVGDLKVNSAASTLAALNPHVSVVTHAERLTPANALERLASYDLVVDGCDNFSTRYLVADACHLASRPLVSGTVGAYDGYLTTFRGFETLADGALAPTYRCLFPNPPSPEQAPACETAGILGALAGVVGSMMALEVLKEIAGAGSGLTGRMLIYDGRDARFQTISYSRDPANPLNGDGDRYLDLSHHGLVEPEPAS